MLLCKADTRKWTSGEETDQARLRKIGRGSGLTTPPAHQAIDKVHVSDDYGEP